MYRTKTCGELRLANAGETVTLAGWVQRARKMGGMTFVDLRDRYGITQLVFNNEVDAQLCEAANHLGREFVIQVSGKVSERSSKNANMPTGEIEIIVDSMTLLNKSEVPPFTIEDNTDGGDDLRMKYDAETKRAEDEFNSKYEEFLDGQRSFAPSILEKRQAELRELMAKNMAFKAESERLLKQAEEEAYAPLKKQIKDVIQKIGKAKGFAFVLNVDGDSLPYVDAAMGEDITELIKENLK